MEVQGKIERLEAEQVISDKFKKREFVVTTDEQYPQSIALEFVNDKCNLLNSYALGDDVKVFINLRGRNWTNPEGIVKTFNTLQAWRIEIVGEADAKQTEVKVVDEQDLPF